MSYFVKRLGWVMSKNPDEQFFFHFQRVIYLFYHSVNLFSYQVFSMETKFVQTWYYILFSVRTFLGFVISSYPGAVFGDLFLCKYLHSNFLVGLSYTPHLVSWPYILYSHQRQWAALYTGTRKYPKKCRKLIKNCLWNNLSKITKLLS